jgi:hypothetical protein
MLAHNQQGIHTFCDPTLPQLTDHHLERKVEYTAVNMENDVRLAWTERVHRIDPQCVGDDARHRKGGGYPHACLKHIVIHGWSATGIVAHWWRQTHGDRDGEQQRAHDVDVLPFGAEAVPQTQRSVEQLHRPPDPMCVTPILLV